MYGLTTISQPAEEPVALAVVKAHLRIDHDAEDALIAAWIAAARMMTEQYTGRRWVTQTVRVRLDGWPCDGEIRLPVEPVSAVGSVEYFDADGIEQTIDAAEYQTFLDHSPPLLLSAPDAAAWPTLQSGKRGAVAVEFTAGYGSAAAVPAPVKAAMLLIIGMFDENRGDQNASAARGIPPAARVLLDLLWSGAY